TAGHDDVVDLPLVHDLRNVFERAQHRQIGDETTHGRSAVAVVDEAEDPTATFDLGDATGEGRGLQTAAHHQHQWPFTVLLEREEARTKPEQASQQEGEQATHDQREIWHDDLEVL